MNKTSIEKNQINQIVHIPADGIKLEGALVIPGEAQGIVLFAHGSGSSRHSPRNNFVAQVLQSAGMGTLLMDLLTPREDATYETRFDIDLLTRRLERATQWLMDPPSASLDIGYFGASTGAAAALQAAATFGPSIGAVVSRGGRPDLAMSALDRVQSPTLLIVGGLDDIVIDLNRQAYDKLTVEKHLAIVPGATHLFEEPGTLQEAARLAADWFKRYLGGKPHLRSRRKLRS
ncbi:MAG TPA: dienelactone hydrolase family protein [Candidatus Binatia bacterium]|nr:dienelactone hydrolase family protein [Candidatus Binatia bacterium]